MTEYTQPCAAIVDGRPATLPALSDRVEFELDGVGYEAFLTAGSVGALAELVAPRVRNLVFRTIRYPGHLDYMRLLLDDLGLRTRRDLLMTVLRNGLPADEPDALVIDVRASGTRGGRPAKETFSRRIEPRAAAGGHSVLALSSAAHAASLIDLLRDGGLHGPYLRAAALVPHETLESRFSMRALGQASSDPAPRS
jgi:saccharopine dehydrogenase-like NADP-dependent oxidoreductase